MVSRLFTSDVAYLGWWEGVLGQGKTGSALMAPFQVACHIHWLLNEGLKYSEELYFQEGSVREGGSNEYFQSETAPLLVLSHD